ncbi:hypothetical protein EW146_g268 [Bondarzewia mesenterica]|uniref:Uncharacterized protein n=1 Tax=Bondarzewia mesenterica TaxID=1095465 RepID=A0A4S4M7W4_9AGAM|nr:hypothetical protein EW146_g268 [Bondarzewia mesenterica]
MLHLAAEVLVQIFRAATFEHIHLPIGEDVPSQPHVVLTISHVCRTWRDIILNVPSLWDVIHTGCSAQLVSACLERSHSIPLRVRIEVPGFDAIPWFLDLVPSFTHRIRDMCIGRADDCADRIASVESIVRVLNKPAPKLERLTIDVRPPNLFTMPIIFSSSTPSLKVISLNQVRWNEGNTFRGLTHLTLATVERCICAHLYETLIHSPGLERLELDGVTPQYPDTVSDIRIVLSRLRHLEIQNIYWSSLCTFLSHIDIPSRCTFICPYLESPVNLPDRMLMSCLPEDISLIRPLHRSTKLAVGLPNALLLCGGNEDSGSAFEVVSGWPLVASSGHFFEQTLLSLIHHFPLDDVQELWLGPLPFRAASTHSSLETWRRTFQGIPRLRTLVLLPGIHVSDVLNAFHPDDPCQWALLPDLMHVRIVYNRFGSVLPWSALEGFLEARRDAGFPLQSLRIQDLFGRMNKLSGCVDGILQHETGKNFGPKFELTGWNFSLYNNILEHEAAY